MSSVTGKSNNSVPESKPISGIILLTTKMPEQQYAKYGRVCLTKDIVRDLGSPSFVKVVSVKDDSRFFWATVQTVESSEAFSNDMIGTNMEQRKYCSLAFNAPVKVYPFNTLVDTCLPIANFVDIEVKLIGQNKNTSINATDFEEHIKNNVFIIGGDGVIVDYMGSVFLLKITSNETSVIIDNETTINFVSDSNIVFVNLSAASISASKKHGSSNGHSFFKQNFNLKSLGIGGMSEEFDEIVRRAFASRMLSQATVEKLGIMHVKGVILYGPPGTGKTLIARKIGEMLNCVKPKIVCGPEIFNKYVGGSEEAIRNLFADAKNDPDKSKIHLIIFDEFDSIASRRSDGSNDGTGARNNVVNQLLSMIDGPEALNNVLVICMTNMFENLDPAVKRPGRLEVHIEIKLPTEEGRFEILQIHTKQLSDSKMLADDVDLKLYSEMTVGYSGAELAGLVGAARSYAIKECTNIVDGEYKGTDEEHILVRDVHFRKAFEHDISPSFGKTTDVVKTISESNKFLLWGDEVRSIYELISTSIQHLNDGQKIVVAINGDHNSGKTLMACTIATASEFSCVRIIRPENMLHLTSERAICDEIVEQFNQVKKSQEGLIIIDQIDRLIEWSPVGLRYNNTILQKLLVLINEKICGGKLFVIVTYTTRSIDLFEILEETGMFDNIYKMPRYVTKEEFNGIFESYGKPIPIDFIDEYTVKNVFNYLKHS